MSVIEEKYRYSCTRIKEYQYTWTYKVPGGVYTVGNKDESPDFWTGENNEYKWDIEMYFGGFHVSYQDYVSVRIYPYYYENKSINSQNRKAMVKLSIIDENNKQKMEQSATITKQNWTDVQFPKFMKRDDLLSSPHLLPNNELKLMCRILFDESATNTVSISKMPTLHCRNVQMSNFEKMFDNPEFSDFQFVVGDTRIKVHKCILAAHSNVFAAMFQSDMIEKNKNEVNIEDIDADVMRQLLRFVYVGEVQDVDDFADKLFIAADKYELNELKNVCEERLISRLTFDNLYKTLLFVDKYDTTKLKDAVIQFIIRNSKKLSTMQELKKSFENLSSALLTRIIWAVMSKAD